MRGGNIGVWHGRVERRVPGDLDGHTSLSPATLLTLGTRGLVLDLDIHKAGG